MFSHSVLYTHVQRGTPLERVRLDVARKGWKVEREREREREL